MRQSFYSINIVEGVGLTPFSFFAHKALIEKAKEEGVSLSQLMVYRLSVGIGRSKEA